MSIYFLIVTAGVIVLFSLFQFSVGDFDWPFFIIMMTYSIVSTVLEILIVKTIVEGHPKVIAARLSVNSSFDRFEKENGWERYKELYLKEHTVSAFYNAYVRYLYLKNDFAKRRQGTKLSESEFKEAFLQKKLGGFLKRERLSLIRKWQILKHQNEQDDTAFIDVYRIKYKRGFYLGKGPSRYLAMLLSFLFQLISFALSIISVFHFSVSFDAALMIKLSLIIVFTIADVYFVVSSVNADVRSWEDWAKAIREVEEVVLDGKSDNLENSLAFYHFQYTPDDREQR